MSERIRPLLRVAATALAVGIYASLSHWCNTRSAPRTLGALIAALPPFFLALALAWRAPHRLWAFMGIAALAVFIGLFWPRLREHYSAVMLLEQVGMWMLLCANFAVTLLPGHEALCTVWADRVHGPLTPDVVRYTRGVTAAWALFFAAVGTISASLYALGHVWVWSVFENFVALPLVAAAFAIEYLVRRMMLPQLRNVGFLEAIRAYSGHR